MPALIEVKNLQKYYGRHAAVDDISFQVESGSCFGLLGPNGAGKSTTIEMMEGIKKPSAGEVLYRGEPLNRRFRLEAGIQFQNTALMDFVTTGEFLKTFSRFYPNPVPLDELIEQCHLEPFLDRYATQLSGGQRQRLLLALALINDPAIVFLDEPTTGLDPQARRNFWELIRRIRARGKTILLTTHYMDEAEQLCDTLAIMDQGKIIAEGTPAHLLESHFGDTVIELHQLTDTTPFSQWPGATIIDTQSVMIESRNIPETMGRLIAENIPLHDVRIKPRTLEDLFLKLTGKQLRE